MAVSYCAMAPRSYRLCLRWDVSGGGSGDADGGALWVQYGAVQADAQEGK